MNCVQKHVGRSVIYLIRNALSTVIIILILLKSIEILRKGSDAITAITTAVSILEVSQTLCQ